MGYELADDRLVFAAVSFGLSVFLLLTTTISTHNVWVLWQCVQKEYIASLRTTEILFETPEA